jgi:hypothetical protein
VKGNKEFSGGKTQREADGKILLKRMLQKLE